MKKKNTVMLQWLIDLCRKVIFLGWAADLLEKYQELIAYGIVGVLTTGINVAVFWAMNTVLGWHYAPANVVAWIIAVVFAFFANKIFVFENHGWSARVVIKEAVAFLLSRLASLLVDMAGMWLMIDCIRCEELLSKFVVNIVVIIINYALGKFWVFAKGKEEKPE